MKRILSFILAVLILSSIFVMPASAISEFANGKYAQQFEDYLIYLGFDPAIEGTENWYTYNEEYEYYSDGNTSQTPDWVLASGYVGEPSPAGSNGIFDEYNLVLSNFYSPRYLYYIYLPSTGKFITLGQAWTDKIEGIEKVFTEYFVPNGYAELIEDSDGDGAITIVDAKKYDNNFTFYNSFMEIAQFIYFDANTTDWENHTQVYCHITGGSIFETPWQSKDEVCTDINNDGVWEYNIAATNRTLHNKIKYEVVFSNNRGDKTPPLTLTTDTLGDVAYQTQAYKLDQNSNKVFMPAWKNHPREIHFDANTTDWTEYTKIYCHIWEAEGDMFHKWQSKQELCTDDNGDGIWSYNLDSAGIYLDESKEYGVIFSNERGEQIYHLALNSDNIGGTVELSGRFAETEHGTQYNIPVWHSEKLYFDANTTNWEDINRIYCHIYEYGGDSFFNWQSKKQRCEDSDLDGIWTYDLESMGIELEDGKLYGVIFSSDKGNQTYNLLFDNTVLGDTAYCDDTRYTSPEDSDKEVLSAFWRNQDKYEFGPEMVILVTGEVVGTCIPRVVTEEDMFKEFLVNKLPNAQTLSGKSDQQLIDDIAKVFEFTANEVEFIFNELEIHYVECAWRKSKSTLPKSNIATPDQLDVHQVVRDYKKESRDKFETKRYYFLMPNVVYSHPGSLDGTHTKDQSEDWTWYNKYAKTAYIYWDGTGRLNLEGVGNMAMIGDSYDVYYADVPDFVTSIVWNNGVKVTDEHDDPMLEYAHRTENIMCEYYDVGESETYPDGLPSFENMIYVLDQDAQSFGDPVAYEKGEWYYYYGDECYGTKENGSVYDCLNPYHHHKPQDIYIVAGVEKLCGSSWDVYDMNNKMTYNEKTGAYEITYENVPVGNHEFMVTKNHQFGPLTPGNPDYNEAKVTVDGSTVKITYTEGGGIDVEVTSSLIGDVDFDSVISIMDATEIQLAIAKKKTLTAEQEKLADTDFDGEISIMDATAIQLYVAKKITEFK